MQEAIEALQEVLEKLENANAEVAKLSPADQFVFDSR